MSVTQLIMIIVFGVATVLGYVLIRAVPSLLHTPLMSGMNALSGITLLGMIAAITFSGNIVGNIFGVLGIVAATINVVAGFGVTDRMLRMFKTHEHEEREEQEEKQ